MVIVVYNEGSLIRADAYRKTHFKDKSVDLVISNDANAVLDDIRHGSYSGRFARKVDAMIL